MLISVFIPIAFLPSTAGRLFREFGLVLACAVVISSFVSLTLVPAAASRLPAADDSSAFRRYMKRIGGRLNDFYRVTLASTLDRPYIPILLALCFAVLCGFAYRNIAQELLPVEDRGFIAINASGPDGVGIGYTDRQTQKIEEIVQPLRDSGEATAILTIVGTWDPNRSRVNIPLVDWSDRERTQQEIMRSLEEPLGKIAGAFVSVSGSNSLNLRRSSGEVEVALVGNDYETIFAAAKKFVSEIEARMPSLSQPQISYDPTQPQLSVDIDRRRAADLGIDLENLASTMRAMIDGDELIDLNVNDEAVPILIESSSGEINDPSDLINLYVTTRDGALVPLSSIVTLREEGIAAELNRQAQRQSK